MYSGYSTDQPVQWEWAQLSFLLGKELIGSPIYKISNYFPIECAIYKTFIHRHLFSRFSIFYGSIGLIPYWFDYSNFIVWWIMCKAKFPSFSFFYMKLLLAVCRYIFFQENFYVIVSNSGINLDEVLFRKSSNL